MQRSLAGESLGVLLAFGCPLCALASLMVEPLWGRGLFVIGSVFWYFSFATKALQLKEKYDAAVKQIEIQAETITKLVEMSNE